MKKLYNIYSLIYLETCDLDREKKEAFCDSSKPQQVQQRVGINIYAVGLRQIYLPSFICLHSVIIVILLKKSCRCFSSEKNPPPCCWALATVGMPKPRCLAQGAKLSSHWSLICSVTDVTREAGRINTEKKKWGKSYVTLHGVLCTVNGTSPVFGRIKCPELKVRCILR